MAKAGIISVSNLPKGLTGLCVASLGDPVRTHLCDPSNLWQPEGDTLKLGSRSTVTLIHINGSAYVLKQYKALSLRRRIRYALTRSRAKQSWEVGLAMVDAGVSIAQPLALIEEKTCGIPARAALLLEHIDGLDLLTHANKFTREELEEIAVKLTDVFSCMKENLITHGDMKASNIIIDKELRPWLIDIDAAVIHRSRASFQKLRTKDRDRFMKNWQQQPEVAQVFADVFGKS
ncbi:MAG: lipopolysaccharide kinase InaA family protein [Akkermansiaceae bacterium]